MHTLTFDTETTGLISSVDRVIELCVMEEAFSKSTVWRFKPPIPITPEAEAVHGISMTDLDDCPAFSDVVDTIYPLFEKADVFIGYNVMFDIDMLNAEFTRCGMTLDIKSKLIVDPLKLWYNLEKRTLESAYERFTGHKLSGAHDAEVDVHAAKDVLEGMLNEWDLVDKSWDELADLCEPDRHKFVGLTNHFLWDDDGNVIFGFGTHKGERAFHQKSYLRWMLSGTFPSSVKQSILEMFKGSLKRVK